MRLERWSSDGGASRNRGYEPEALIDGREGIKGQWDGVVLVEVLEHVPDPIETIEQIDGALNPNGVIALTQAFCHYADGTVEFPRRGEVLVWLARHGYRLHHIRGVAWFAHKETLGGFSRLAQRTSIAGRVMAAKMAMRLPGTAVDPAGASALGAPAPAP